MAVSGFRVDAEFRGKAADGETIALDAESAKRCERGGCNKRMMTEALARIDVRHVDFNGRNFYADQRVMQRDRGVRISARIDDDASGFLGAGLVNEVDQFAFAIGLPAIGRQAEMRGGGVTELLDIGQCVMAVGLRLTRAEQIKVRPVEHIDRLCHPKPKSSNVGEKMRGKRGFGRFISNKRLGWKPERRFGVLAKPSRYSRKGR